MGMSSTLLIALLPAFYTLLACGLPLGLTGRRIIAVSAYRSSLLPYSQDIVYTGVYFTALTGHGLITLVKSQFRPSEVTFSILSIEGSSGHCVFWRLVPKAPVPIPAEFQALPLLFHK